VDAVLTVLLLALSAGALAGAASAPHCFAMCGPLAVFAGRLDARGTPFLRALRYHCGRAAAYVAIGAISGGSGAALASFLSPRWASTILAFVLGTAMIASALRLLFPGREPKLAKLGRAPSRPPLAAQALGLLPREPAVVGAVSALLPCGALYAALWAAAGTGSAFSGALAMLAFALTSAVGLVLFAWIGQRMRGTRAGSIVLAVVLFAGALFVLARPFLADEDGPTCHEVHDPS
jgi:sulfite exporter TauE/SafE